MVPGGDPETVMRLERLLFDPDVRGSPITVASLLSDDFVEFTRSGRVCRKDEVVRSLAAETGDASAPIADDFEFTPLAGDVVLPRYRTVRAGHDGAELRTLRSSIWRRVDGPSMMLFHQGTPATF